MFSKLVNRNSKRDRKDNGLYFGSMIISIIAFFIILSLPNQDVMIFLKKMESDAVSRLFAIVPVFYVLTLVILFFLVYFASNIQIERRKHEFGVYLMLGMKRSKLFSMLLLEDIRNNVVALGIGIPVAVMISELISLLTAKVVGLGIIGHKISFSVTAVIFTILGFLAVKLIAFVILSFKEVRKDIGELLSYTPAGVKKQLPAIIYLISGCLGIFMLGYAYHYGMSGKAWEGIYNMGITVLLGTVGTILLFFGIRLFISTLLKLDGNKDLHTYNYRQIQELVIRRSTIIAMCSLLIFSALCLFGAGVAISMNTTNDQTHVLDYTFRDDNLEYEENLKIGQVKNVLKEANLESDFLKILEVKVGYPKEKSTVSFANIVRNIESTEPGKAKETLAHNLEQYDDCHIISLSGYNELRKAVNKNPIHLNSGEAALYMGKDFVVDERLVNLVIKSNPKVNIMKEQLKITGEVESLPIVTDREITLSIALIVPDDVFERYTNGKYSGYISGILNQEIVKEKGLMRAISDINDKLEKTKLGYESYIQNMGRQLFFVISASYITIYLAIIFLVVANTIIGVQFLMGQRKSYKRYQTLIHLGATYDTLCKSSNKQINWHFGLPIVVAVVNSFFGVASLFTGILPSGARVNIVQEFLMAILIIFLLGIIEFIYMFIVKKNSNKYLWTIMQPKREE